MQLASLWPKTPIGPQRLGDRSLLLFHVGQMAIAYVDIGEFEKAEEVLANPLTREQPPAARVYTANAELTMAAWRGDIDGVGRLDAEVTRLISRWTIRRRRIPFGISGSTWPLPMTSSNRRFLSPPTDSRSPPGLNLRALGPPFRHSPARRCGALRPVDPSVRAAPAAFSDYHTTCQILAPAVDGPVDTREIDAIIARRKGWGSVADVACSRSLQRRSPPRTSERSTRPRPVPSPPNVAGTGFSG